MRFAHTVKLDRHESEVVGRVVSFHGIALPLAGVEGTEDFVQKRAINAVIQQHVNRATLSRAVTGVRRIHEVAKRESDPAFMEQHLGWSDGATQKGTGLTAPGTNLPEMIAETRAVMAVEAQEALLILLDAMVRLPDDDPLEEN